MAYGEPTTDALPPKPDKSITPYRDCDAGVFAGLMRIARFVWWASEKIVYTKQYGLRYVFLASFIDRLFASTFAYDTYGQSSLHELWLIMWAWYMLMVICWTFKTWPQYWDEYVLEETDAKPKQKHSGEQMDSLSDLFDETIYELEQRRDEEKRESKIHKLWIPQSGDMVQERYGANRIGVIISAWESWGTIWHTLDIEQSKSCTKDDMIYLPRTAKEKTNGEQMDSLSDLFEGYEDVERPSYETVKRALESGRHPNSQPPPPPSPDRPCRDVTRL